MWIVRSKNVVDIIWTNGHIGFNDSVAQGSGCAGHVDSSEITCTDSRDTNTCAWRSRSIGSVIVEEGADACCAIDLYTEGIGE